MCIFCIFYLNKCIYSTNFSALFYAIYFATFNAYKSAQARPPDFSWGGGGGAHISLEEEGVGTAGTISYKIKQKTNENCLY